MRIPFGLVDSKLIDLENLERRKEAKTICHSVTTTHFESRRNSIARFVNQNSTTQFILLTFPTEIDLPVETNGKLGFGILN
ncbi:hypothetical protein F0562_013029 [Nyssa sinensis]|uniref:Uncharacterized protein n=1 Tax=Nyssa sinensis TaxID=561372 RepID=A0A5J4ZW49_9ASTE|nr:hypothetical protein F0562_013029 [Nyssa sinensis]